MAHKETYDVIVIGAGIEGSATAYNLVNMKKKVLLLEQFALPHTRGSSHGQSRIIRKAYTQTCYAEMMDEAYAMWSTLEKETDTKLYQKTGLLVVSQPPSQAVNHTEHALKRQGASYRRLNGSELRQEFSMMRFGSDYDALYEDEAGILRADKCLQALQRMFVARGGVLRDAEPVTNVTPGPRVTVTSSLRSYDAGSVVITAGPWTSRLTKPLGLNLPLRVEAVKVCYYRELNPNALTSSIAGYPACFADHGNEPNRCSIYGLPSFDYPGLAKVCSHTFDEVDPDTRDLVHSTRDLEELEEFVLKHLPGLESKPSIIERCMYTTTPDADFILDRHPHHDNIVIGAGFTGHGFKMAPVIGRILGEMATGAPPSYNLQPFRISRFYTLPVQSKM